MSSLHRHQTAPPYVSVATLPPYAPLPYAPPLYAPLPYTPPLDTPQPPPVAQHFSFKDGNAPTAKFIPLQSNIQGPREVNSRWVAALSGDMGEAAQRNAHEKLSTQLTSTIRNFLLYRRPNLQWLASLAAVEIEALTQDLVQVCLMKLSRDEHALLAKFSGIGTFRGWVAQIALNVTRSELRKAQWDRNQPLESLFHIPDNDAPTPESTLMQAQLASVLHRCLAQLPDHYKTVLVRCVMNGERTDAVARDLERSSQAVYNLVSRAKKELGALLTKAGVDKADLVVFGE